VETHDDHFPQGALDREWLPEVGERGWVPITKDREIRYRAAEREALLDDSLLHRQPPAIHRRSVTGRPGRDPLPRISAKETAEEGSSLRQTLITHGP